MQIESSSPSGRQTSNGDPTAQVFSLLGKSERRQGPRWLLFFRVGFFCCFSFETWVSASVLNLGFRVEFWASAISGLRVRIGLRFQD